MTLASHLSMLLARFDSLRLAGGVEPMPRQGVLFRSVAADTRAAAMEPGSQRAFVFLVLGLHSDEASAHGVLDGRRELTPWLDEAAEVWGAVLEPFRHTGVANYLDRSRPGALFDAVGAQPAAAEPIVIVTSVGWTMGERFDMNRVREFGTGVMGVRAAMSGIPGLLSQQSFFFSGLLEHDPLTVTLWRDTAAARAFAYGPGVHKVQMQRLRDEGLADRTSFTRCRILRSDGTWHGLSLPPLHEVARSA